MQQPLQLLAKANFELMTIYDLAANTLKDENLKKFFESQATHAEEILNGIEGIEMEDDAGFSVLPAAQVVEQTVRTKPATAIINHFKLVEKGFLKLLRSIEPDLKSLPKSFSHLFKQNRERYEQAYATLAIL